MSGSNRPHQPPLFFLASLLVGWGFGSLRPLASGLPTAAFGLLLDSVWVLAMVPVLVLLLDRLVIAREEVRLRAQFGEAYVAYQLRVRRWL